MRIIRKKGLDKMKITHNKKLLWIILVLIIALIAVIYFIVKNNGDNNIINTLECSVDSDCIPNACCHATGCMPKENVSACTLFCTQVCSGPLDCGAGHCGCIANKCEVVPSK
jgi:hypothetical protein